MRLALIEDPDGGKQEILRIRPWELLGFGCHYAWLLSIAFGTTIYARFESSELVATLRLLIFVCLAVMFAALFFAQHFAKQFTFKKPLVVGAGLLGSTGTLLLLVPGSSTASWIVWIVGGLAIGFSNAVSMTAGNRLWANNRPEYGMLQLTVSTVLAVLLFYAFLVFPFKIAIFCIAALPLAGDMILIMTKGGKQRSSTYRKYEGGLPQSIDLRLLAYVFTFALSTGCMLATIASFDVPLMISNSGKLMTGTLLAAVFTLWAALRRKPAGMLKLIDKPVSALFVIGLAGLLITPNQPADPSAFPTPNALVMAAYVLVDQFLWLINPDLVFRAQKPSAAILARSCSFEWAGLAVGFFLGCAASGFWGISLGIGYPIILFWCLCLFMLMRTFTFSHMDAVKLAEARVLPLGEDELAEQCRVLAEQYALSPRETDVFMLLARGRSGPFIQTELTLSQSTIKTHTRNIYRKFNVSSKQDLLDLVGKDL